MSNIKEEIISSVKEIHKTNSNLEKIVTKVSEELEEMDKTTGLEGKNNLESFYGIWKSWKERKGHAGSENQINSWAAFALKMTTKKPEGDFLPVRRAFARVGFPDIDTDFDYENRDDIYKYIIDQYGRGNVGNVGTHGKLKFKSCITRVVKALDIANAFHKDSKEYISENAAKVTEILSSFPKMGALRIQGRDNQMHDIKGYEDAYAHSEDFKYYMDKYPDIGKFAKDIEGTFANFGAHASGMVVSDIPLSEIAPLRTARGEMLATQFPYEDLEAIGMIKFDILAISTLSVVKRTIEMIKKNWGIEIDYKNLPLDDEKTLRLYREGNLGGIFQCEKYGMQNTMKEIGVDSFNDIVAALALYRPGPMDNIPQYCDRKKGNEQVDYFHSSIEPYVKQYLEDTYGICVYQEQLMQICNALAGFTITDGYTMIKAIGKKIPELMALYEKQFIDGAFNNKVNKELGKNYWDRFITPFAQYGFNRAHSAAYGYTSYQTAYLKANYPDEFICSLLEVTINSSVGDRYEKVTAFEAEFSKKMNIKFLPRDINKSKVEFKIERRKNIQAKINKTEIRPSLLCKGLSVAAAENIEQNQPFADLKEFVAKTDSSVVDMRCLEALIDGGYFGRKAQENKDKMKEQFMLIREDLKKAAKKGIESFDLFA